tara:strand:+ start:2547 stop:2666 length:120 start_codon:yes stop_codon:yes gene_type:complete
MIEAVDLADIAPARNSALAALDLASGRDKPAIPLPTRLN